MALGMFLASFLPQCLVFQSPLIISRKITASVDIWYLNFGTTNNIFKSHEPPYFPHPTSFLPACLLQAILLSDINLHLPSAKIAAQAGSSSTVSLLQSSACSLTWHPTWLTPILQKKALYLFSKEAKAHFTEILSYDHGF